MPIPAHEQLTEFLANMAEEVKLPSLSWVNTDFNRNPAITDVSKCKL